MSILKTNDPRTQELIDYAELLPEDAIAHWYESLSPDDRECMRLFVKNAVVEIEAVWNAAAEAIETLLANFADWWEDVGRHYHAALFPDRTTDN
jgi:hypothetical protein